MEEGGNGKTGRREREEEEEEEEEGTVWLTSQVGWVRFWVKVSVCDSVQMKVKVEVQTLISV